MSGEPQQVPALSAYLNGIPCLADALMEQLANALDQELFDHNNAEEMRLAFKEAQQLALEKIKDAGLAYYSVVYPQVLYKCPRSGKELKGAYWEISNPITNQRGMFRLRVVHSVREFQEDRYTEPIINMSDTVMGEDEHVFDRPKLAKILQGLNVPPALQAELAAPYPVPAPNW